MINISEDIFRLTIQDDKNEPTFTMTIACEHCAEVVAHRAVDVRVMCDADVLAWAVADVMSQISHRCKRND